jgi:segregation and condensation protein A
MNAPETASPLAGEPEPAGGQPAVVAEQPEVAAEQPEVAAEQPEVAAEQPGSGRFMLKLVNFEGPFDLLLQLIGKHKLDVTEVALHRVTDEFIAHIRAMGDAWDLDEASEFLVIAATLLDLKAARLLPAAAVEDEEDLALLEARDLLFARLLQYRAFKQAAAHLADLAEVGQRRWPRAVALEQRYADALPDLVLGVGPERLAKLAAKAFSPKPGPPTVSMAHVHDAKVSVREHAEILRDRLQAAGTATFRVLIADCQSTLEVVARFLALLELYRENLIGFDQIQPLGELTVRWTAADDAPVELDFDEYAGSPADRREAPGDGQEGTAGSPADRREAPGDGQEGTAGLPPEDAHDGQGTAAVPDAAA